MFNRNAYSTYAEALATLKELQKFYNIDAKIIFQDWQNLFDTGFKDADPNDVSFKMYALKFNVPNTDPQNVGLIKATKIMCPGMWVQVVLASIFPPEWFVQNAAKPAPAPVAPAMPADPKIHGGAAA